MSKTESPSAVLRSMVEMFDTGDVTAVASVVSPDYVDHQGLGSGEIIGVDGFCRVVRAATSAYISLDVVIEDLIADHDRAVVRLLWLGTTAAGDEERRETIDIVRVAGGLAVEHWGTRIR